MLGVTFICMLEDYVLTVGPCEPLCCVPTVFLPCHYCLNHALLIFFYLYKIVIREWGDNVLARTNPDIPRKHKGERT